MAKFITKADQQWASARLGGLEPRTIGAGEYSFIEPGDPHVETVVEDRTAFVGTAEDRAKLYESFVPVA